MAGGRGGGGFYLRHPANLSVADGGHLARTSYTTVMMVLTPMIGGGILAGLFGLRLGLLVSVLAILVSFCLRPGYILTLMDADGVLTAAQSSWFTAQVVLLAVGIVGVVAWVRLKTNVAVLATTSLVVIAAELWVGSHSTTCGRCRCNL